MRGLYPTRYKHAARHVREIDSLNRQIGDYENFETHDQFMERLRKAHARKTGFWSCCAIETRNGCPVLGEERKIYTRIELFRF
jgi:hypothetical protein